MIAQSVRAETKPLIQNGETSPNSKGSRFSPKTKDPSKPKSQIFFKGCTSTSCLSPEDGSKTSIRRPMEETQLKLKMLELTPRNPANQTSQGVQDFIKQVSRFIEKKNPFKSTTENQSCTDAMRTENEGNITTGHSRVVLEKSNAKKQKSHPEKSERSRRSSGRMQGSKSRTMIPNRKGVQRGGDVNVRLDGRKTEEQRRNAQQAKALQKEGNRKEIETKALPKVESPGVREEVSENGVTSNHSSRVRSSQIRRSGRSEIPLRKTRTDMSRSPKAVSLLLHKPLKDAESTISIDFYTKRKPFTPIEELSLCSEVQSGNASDSKEKLNRTVNKSSPGVPRKDLIGEVSNGFKLDRCSKSPNIPVISDPSYSDISEQKLCTVKKSKILDLEKMRTSSFTVLRNSREALCRLESFHQQNVSTKENVFGEKSNPSRLKLITSKPSFNSLKGKSSKKNLSARSSSKGNKPALKAKTRKMKKDDEENVVPLKKTRKSKAVHVDAHETVTTTPENVLLTDDFGENLTNEGINLFLTLEVSDSGGKSSTPGSRSSDKKESSIKDESSGTKTQKEVDELKLSRDEMLKRINSAEDCVVEQTPMVSSPPEKESDSEEATVIEGNGPEERQTDEDERSSSKTVTLGGRVMDEVSSLSSEGSQSGRKSSKGGEDLDLSVKGMSLKFGKDEPPEKPEGLESKRNKLHIKINLTALEDTDYEENDESDHSFNRLFHSTNIYTEEQSLNDDPNDEKNKEVKMERTPDCEELSEVVMNESTAEEEGSVTTVIQKSRKSTQILRTRPQHKGANLKGVRRKKMRSDAGDRPLPSSAGFFKSISLQNKMKLDTKLRSGLTKSYIPEVKRDLFDETAPVKLKRRNSEPISFRGYIWKPADAVTPRGHKASVSSMTSSLKHLNTDDIDDFIFWEAVPQKMTSCWEMSLYHFKRPWSVLSCSVFEDNRQSNTPGLILENLRNGGNFSRRSTFNCNERLTSPKDNPFDVEPSIAQKNIDIRNWLAALNFPTIPSTSADLISDDIESPADAQNLNKEQVCPKRRKVAPNVGFPEETSEKPEEKDTKHSSKWNTSEVGGLMDLIRRKSGGFVTNEQFLNSEHSLRRQNVTVNLCLYSKTPEISSVRESHERNVSSEPKTFKTGGKSSFVDRPKVEEPPQKDIPDSTVVQTSPVRETQRFKWNRILERDLPTLPSEVNIWKYLFLITLFIICIHYCLNNSSGRS